MWINEPQFLYYNELEWGKFISYNNTRERPANLGSNENDSCLTNQYEISTLFKGIL